MVVWFLVANKKGKKRKGNEVIKEYERREGIKEERKGKEGGRNTYFGHQKITKAFIHVNIPFAAFPLHPIAMC